MPETAKPSLIDCKTKPNATFSFEQKRAKLLIKRKLLLGVNVIQTACFENSTSESGLDRSSSTRNPRQKKTYASY
jgi:hypothetical protein